MSTSTFRPVGVHAGEATAGRALPSVFLIGGGWDARGVEAIYGRFVDAAGSASTIACVLLDEPGHEQYFSKFAQVLSAAGARRVEPVFVGADRALALSDVDGADGVLVGGGLTPAYVNAVAAVRETLPRWLIDNDVPYAGFSAGAAIAARDALIGGWKLPTVDDLVTVCPEEVAEDLKEVTVVDGLGLVPFAVDVHASAWGTISRLVSVIEAGLLDEGWAVDEDTMLAVENGRVTVHGLGRAYHVRAADAGVTVEMRGTVVAKAGSGKTPSHA